MTTEYNAGNPPSNFLDIFDTVVENNILLDQQLNQNNILNSSLTTTITQNYIPVNSNGNQQQQQQRIDNILRTADFLFGSLLDGAISILDTDPRRDILQLISLQSGRSLYIVKGSLNNYKNNINNNNNSDNTAIPDSSYICMLPNPLRIINDNDNSSSSVIDNENYNIIQSKNSSFYYCSCRSFLERCRSSSHTTTTAKTTTTTPVSFCKHLLALKLMKVMNVQCSIVETSSDEEFSKLLLQKISFD